RGADGLRVAAARAPQRGRADGRRPGAGHAPVRGLVRPAEAGPVPGQRGPAAAGQAGEPGRQPDLPRRPPAAADGDALVLRQPPVVAGGAGVRGQPAAGAARARAAATPCRRPAEVGGLMEHASHGPDPGRRHALRALLAAAGAGTLPARLRAATPAPACPGPWREWPAFVARHVEQDGRVVDFANPDLRSTSESQSYGLFFALVDNDQLLFERILAWTRRHLSGGRADLNLPAWLWGRAGDGSWRVLDPN